MKTSFQLKKQNKQLSEEVSVNLCCAGTSLIRQEFVLQQHKQTDSIFAKCKSCNSLLDIIVQRHVLDVYKQTHSRGYVCVESNYRKQ